MGDAWNGSPRSAASNCQDAQPELRSRHSSAAGACERQSSPMAFHPGSGWCLVHSLRPLHHTLSVVPYRYPPLLFLATGLAGLAAGMLATPAQLSKLFLIPSSLGVLSLTWIYHRVDGEFAPYYRNFPPSDTRPLRSGQFCDLLSVQWRTRK